MAIKAPTIPIRNLSYIRTNHPTKPLRGDLVAEAFDDVSKAVGQLSAQVKGLPSPTVGAPVAGPFATAAAGGGGSLIPPTPPSVQGVTIANVQQQTYTYADDTGTANAYAVTLASAPTIVEGSVVVLKIANASTGASTLAVNGGTPTAIKKESGGSLVDIASGDFSAGQVAILVFDGTYWQWVDSVGGGGGGLNGVNAQSGDYTLVSGDNGKLVVQTSNANHVFTLPASPPSSTWAAFVQNAGTAALTVSPNGLDLDGASGSIIISQNQGVVVFTDGSNYFTERGTDDRAVFPVSAVAGLPAAGQLVMIFTDAAAVLFPANFSGSQGSVGTNPTATATYTVYKNGSTVGQIVISTVGVFTFTTTGGATVSLNAGDRLTIVAPGSQDATLADVGITLVGTRVGSVQNAAPPIFTWKGAYSGSTTYQPYDVVSYTDGSSYVCILTTTGNAPGNTTYWNLLAQAGASGTVTAAQVQGESFTYAADTGSANAYAATLSPAPTVGAGSFVVIKIANANTGASTLALNGGTATAIKKESSGSLVALASGDLNAGQLAIFIHDGTQWQWLGGGGGGGGDLTAKYVLGAADALLTNAVVNPTAFYGPDAAPASPGTLDDEFNGSSLNAKWTVVNPGAGTWTTAVGNSQFQTSVPNCGSDHFGYIYQTAPSTPYTVTAKVATLFIDQNYYYSGLCFADSSGKVVEFFIGNGGTVQVNYWNSTTSFNSKPTNVTLDMSRRWIYMRMKDDGTNFTFWVSMDGTTWLQVGGTLGRTAFLSSPARVGIASGNNMSSTTTYMSVDWFRQS